MLEVLPDPLRDVLLVRFSDHGPLPAGRDRGATPGQHRPRTTVPGSMMRYAYARHGDFACAWRPTRRCTRLSCGYVGASDGWQDLARHGRLTYAFTSADSGTVALSGRGGRSQRGAGARISPVVPRGAHTRARTALAAVVRCAAR